MKDLDKNQLGAQKHKSPQAAYAKGYYDGITDSYK